MYHLIHLDHHYHFPSCGSPVRRSCPAPEEYRQTRDWKSQVAQGATEPVPQVEQQQVSAELVAQMRASISEALEAERVDISDTYGDGRHVSIDVVSRLFEGQSAVKRQRMVLSTKINLGSDFVAVRAAVLECDRRPLSTQLWV